MTAALALQAAWRYTLALRGFVNAATQLQRYIRGWAGRVRAIRYQNALQTLALRTQAHARRKRARKFLHHAKAAAVVLQCWHRSQVAQRRAQQRKTAEASMAAFWRSSRERRLFERKRRASTRLQVRLFAFSFCLLVHTVMLTRNWFEVYVILCTCI
jgi:hypothetical protein